jgi:hypothetical protein
VGLTNDDGAAVRAWTSAALNTDDGVRRLAKAFTSFGWTRVLGDAVAKREARVNLQDMAGLIDLDAFRPCVEALVSAGGYPEVQEFVEAWRRADGSNSS